MKQKIKNLKVIFVLIIFFSVSSWLYIGYPKVWFDPLLPPNIKKAYAMADFKVQRGTLTNFGADEDVQTVVLEEPVASLSSAFVRITNTMSISGGPVNSAANQEVDDMGATVELSDVNTLTFTRESTGSNLDQRVEWELVEYIGQSGGDNEFIVRQQGMQILSSTNLTVDISNISNLDKAVPFLTGVRNSDNTNDGNQLAVTLFMENAAGQDRLSANRGGTTADTSFSYAVVEFVGVNWNIGHIRHRFTSTADQIVPMYQEADAYGSGTVFDVGNWNTAFIESQHQVDTEEALDEISNRMWRNPVDTTSLIMDLDAGADNIPGRNYIGQAHIIQNDQMFVEWFDSGAESAYGISNDADFDISVSDVGDMSQASVFSTLTSSGGGTAYSRNARNYQLTAPTNVHFWGHRTGNDLNITLAVVSWPETLRPNTEQLHFRWRDDSGGLNASVGWLDVEDSNGANQFRQDEIYRLRIEIANTGDGAESASRAYELQWSEKSSDCALISNWTGIGDASDEWAMVDSANITPDGEATNPGLLSNSEAYTYINGEGRDTADTTSLLGPINANNYTELEYSLQPTGSAAAGASYCFRVFDASAGEALDNYAVYPEATIASPVIEQLHFRFRNNSTDLNADGGWIAGEDVNAGAVSGSIYRLRIEIANSGLADYSSPQAYELQWGEKLSDCASISTWTGIGDASDEWTMVDSANIAPDGEATNPGLLSNSEAYTFINGEGRDAADTTSSLGPINFNNYTELEYSLQATAGAMAGASYCFRVFDASAGEALDSYTVYPELTILEANDFFVQRGSLQISGISATINAGIDYQAPADLSKAFIRVTNTQHVGAGHDLGGGSQNADDVTVLILNPENLLSNIIFRRPDAAQNNTRVSWEIVEYIGPPNGPNEIIVRDQSYSFYGDSELNISSPVINDVENDAKLVPFITSQATSDSARNDYNTVLSTADWNGANNQIDFSRGEAGADPAYLSWAAVEFVGANWQIQRIEHAYSSSGAIETENINAVNDLSRAFLHVQKRNGTNLTGLDEFGHEVWLSAVDAISFQIEGGATNPGGQTSVVWLIENIQTDGAPMIVTRSNGTQSGGDEPSAVNVDIGKTLADTSIASIFVNNRVTGAGTAYPRPIMAAEIISASQYQLWISDTGQTRTYRTEIVEWPTAKRYKTTGTYISSAFDTGGKSAFNIIQWNWSASGLACLSCNLKLQIQTAPDKGGAPGAWSTTWCGPDGEDGDETDYYTISTGELIHTDHNSDQWVRYRAILEGTISYTPVLEEVKINYKNY